MAKQAGTVKIDTDSCAFRLFVGSLKGKSAREAYILGLKNFMEYAKLETIDDLLRLEPKALQDKIIDFVMEERRAYPMPLCTSSLPSCASSVYCRTFPPTGPRCLPLWASTKRQSVTASMQEKRFSA